MTKGTRKKRFCNFASASLIFFAVSISAQSGGNFTITESVVASGGGQQTAGGTFSVDGTMGQPVAGNSIIGAPFAVTSGFWNFTPTAPTAAAVEISGQVRTVDGNGIRNAILTLTAANGATRIARSSGFGYYVFADVVSGGTYVIGISTKRYTFVQSAIVLTVLDPVAELDFVAEPLP